ncbi:MULTISPECIES: VanZ family protein [Bacillus cereus group]|uniref:VanZ-like domain-containing protein n=1 Tax=Bacillus thuringiensis TaxID=1428 RepID=A0A9X6WIG7_BACTU|nr:MULTISPECIES: VanZ family protein [Bacillus cereus group]PFJ30253.1 hypothetical protein COJ15_31090 [Bacillus thuringiensis]PGP12504.1 hypothetical protein COA01_32315 [Bacillus cereus]
MIKKILLGIMIVIIFQLSSTSSLKVIHPKTWSNQTIYDDKANISDVFHLDSRFYGGYFPHKNGIFYADLDFFAHKISHITAYAILSILILSNIKSRKHAFKRAWLGVVLIAFLDECNQYLVVGRTGLFLDVIVDSASAFIALLTVYTLWQLAMRNRQAIPNTNGIKTVVKA